MSKAFTRESDGDDDDKDLDESKPVPGGKNYMTPGCEKRLRDELQQLLNVERPKVTELVTWAASLGDRSENADYIYNKKKLREIDRRIRFLSKRLESAEVIDPTQVKADEVRFGATVQIKYESGATKTYSIVGVDEIDVKKGRISWVSPLGTALLKAKKGDFIHFRSPKGEEEIEILSVKYVALD